MGLAKLELKKICTEHKNVEFITLIIFKKSLMFAFLDFVVKYKSTLSMLLFRTHRLYSWV